ncbi:TetR/AcrR family transcriptional regulator [Motiliproteus sp. MSK22-1]|uniref:TetR/AcrR family transcriptional regulator n=1 Tax=Motiliproteus sp. MSK22-1 TaxID=1897630 RepID=UPI0009779508|nr:TetR/AcrR family transcriptional regulator [Motiliproteus sp. MSK22-1]OMH28034.1 hypothetical protein BGP75_21940 [Motiliproteus sp. MSK22-1]
MSPRSKDVALINRNQLSVRERLLIAAKYCFLEEDYHRVSTRKIAEEASTTIAMIRYYFGNKEGLYQEMIKKQIEPVMDAFKALNDGPLPDNLKELFSAYYSTMVPNPEFPILMMKTLSLKQGPSRNFIIKNVVIPFQRLFFQLIERQQQQGKIDADYDPQLLEISAFSLMVMPMLARPMLEEKLGKPADLNFYLTLATHNSQLLSRGCLPSAIAEKDL